MKVLISICVIATSLLNYCSSPRAIAGGDGGSLASPTPPTTIMTTDKGEYINPAGWCIPNLPEHRDYKPTFWLVDGKKIKILSFWYFSKSKVIIEEPFQAMGSKYVGHLFDVTEFKTKGKKPFCYRIATTREMPEGVNNSGGLTVINIRDVDGDGVFETLGGGCPLPDWAK